MASGKSKIAMIGYGVVVYVGLVTFLFSLAGAAGLFGDSGHQRVEDLGFAAVGLVALVLARRQLIRQDDPGYFPRRR